ncbi:hypothetical protein SDC9_173344 [bioreactor metagenome]|uniref:Uncharacterized protein n=1 Tax=bioreactor metagenome TaxID=1076179 RepID=A0A645GQH5_9ZZZZ
MKIKKQQHNKNAVQYRTADDVRFKLAPARTRIVNNRAHHRVIDRIPNTGHHHNYANTGKLPVTQANRKGKVGQHKAAYQRVRRITPNTAKPKAVSCSFRYCTVSVHELILLIIL